MKRVAWMTDIHLNFLGTEEIETWLHTIAQTPFDALIISGDIGEAPKVQDYLLRLDAHFHVPIYYVLGNHDYYHSSIANVNESMRQLSERNPRLHWLSDQPSPIPLSPTTALIGHEGWADGRYGSYYHSPIILNDYVLIRELARITQAERLERLQQLGDVGARHLERLLPQALTAYERVFVVMHAPPFREACYYKGIVAQEDDPYLPHFTCKAHGDVLLRYAEQYPDRHITVLCGHTHGGCDVTMRPNLRVLCADAEYREPRIAQVFNLE